MLDRAYTPEINSGPSLVSYHSSTDYSAQVSDLEADSPQGLGATEADAVCDLIDLLAADDDLTAEMAAAIEHLETMDPERAAERRAWF